MASMIASDSDRTGHEQHICDACSRENEFISASKWCKDCKEALCEAQYPVESTKDLMTADVKLVKVVTVGSMCLKPEENKPWFTGGEYMNCDQLLLVDGSNDRLVLLNEDMKVKREIKVNGDPSCIDLSDDEKVVHVVCDNDSVHHYSLPGGEEVDRRMEVENGAWGIAIIGDATIIGHVGTSKKIALYDVKGNTIKSVPSRRSVFNIAVSNNGDQIYYSSGDEIYYSSGDAVIACDMELNEKWKYRSGDLKGPRGICVDPYDNVYVVGKDSKNIHQISGDGTRHRVLVHHMDKMGNPSPIVVFSKRKDEFVVTSGREGVAFEVYQFSP